MALDPGTLVKLRAFEAVGRNMSFNLAARELAVTPTALSHHVRHLEDQLGQQLFHRLHRQIVLTETGQTLLAACTSGLSTLDRAVHDATRTEHDATLTVSVAPYFSARWLTPRLANFWSAHPEIELRLHHAYQPADFSLDRVDAGIAWGHGRWTGTHAVRVLTGELTALCSPKLRRAMPETPKPSRPRAMETVLRIRPRTLDTLVRRSRSEAAGQSTHRPRRRLTRTAQDRPRKPGHRAVLHRPQP